MHDLETDGHRARKRFGQNFLSDPNIIRKIIDGIRPQPGELMVEIGPGLGAMTAPLIERLGHLHVVEIDRDLIARLHERYTTEQLTVHEGDALKFDFGSLCGSQDAGAQPALRIVGKYPDTLKGRAVGILVTDGADGAVVDAVKAAAEGQGATVIFHKLSTRYGGKS